MRRMLMPTVIRFRGCSLGTKQSETTEIPSQNKMPLSWKRPTFQKACGEHCGQQSGFHAVELVGISAQSVVTCFCFCGDLAVVEDSLHWSGFMKAFEWVSSLAVPISKWLAFGDLRPPFSPFLFPFCSFSFDLSYLQHCRFTEFYDTAE